MRVTRKIKDTRANTVLGVNLGNILREWPEFVIKIKTLNIVSYDQIAGKHPLSSSSVRPNEV